MFIHNNRYEIFLFIFVLIISILFVACDKGISPSPKPALGPTGFEGKVIFKVTGQMVFYRHI